MGKKEKEKEPFFKQKCHVVVDPILEHLSNKPDLVKSCQILPKSVKFFFFSFLHGDDVTTGFPPPQIERPIFLYFPLSFVHFIFFIWFCFTSLSLPPPSHDLR